MPTVRKGAVIWKGKPADCLGPELRPGDRAPGDYTLVGGDLATVAAADLACRRRIVLSVPSLDTAVCDTETRRFNEEATKIPGVQVVVVSMDLPFAQKRWCGAAGVERVRTLSDYRDRSFGPAWGVLNPERGLLARAVFVVDAADVLRHVEYVKDVGTEPDYAAAIAAAKAMS